MSRRQGGFWSNLLGIQGPRERERFSLEELQHLHEVLRAYAVVTDQNRESVIEALRSIAELTIWGDQNDPRFFEYFLENNLMQHFSALLQIPANRSGNVARQVLQTLYMLVSNIRSRTAIYYILSNNHVNDIITLPLDFEDDEVLGYYINLLKTISLCLTDKSVQFFFQDDGVHKAFPLYTEAVKFVDHRDKTVSAAARTTTLNVYKVGDENIQDFLTSPPASNYFHELATIITEQCQLLDRKLSSLEAGTSSAAHSVKTKLEDVEDLLSYSNDVLGTGRPELRQKFMERLWVCFVRPVLLEPLHQLANPTPAASEGVLPLCSLCILERLLFLVNDEDFLNAVTCALLGLNEEAASLFCSDTSQRGVPWQPEDDCKAGFLGALKGGETVIAAAAIRVVFRLIESEVVDADLLDANGLLPRQKKIKQLEEKKKKKQLEEKQLQLLDLLTADGREGCPQERMADLFGPRLSQESSAPVPPRTPPGSTSRQDSAWDSTSETDWQVQLEGGEDWIDALFGLLLLELLPSTGLWVSCYVLLELLFVPSGCALNARQQSAVKEALRRAHSAFVGLVNGVWTDAVPAVVLLEWKRAEQQLSTAPQSWTQAAVQAWMQAIQAQKLAIDVGAAGQAGQSAREAATMLHVVQRLVALSHMHQALVAGQFPMALPIVAASEQHMKQVELWDGRHVSLSEPLPCSVSFKKGAERRVLMVVHGIPTVREGGRLTREEEVLIASSCPCVVLANTTPEEGKGTVISVASLLGAQAYTNAQHPCWLHVHVRPASRGMLKTIRNADMGEVMQQLDKQLQDGHWVLAFSTPSQAKAAQELLRREAERMSELLKSVLSPLIL